MSDSVAAALSQLRHPRYWSRVDFTAAPNGQSWTMRVEYVGNSHPQEILIPADLYREVLDLLALVRKVDGYTADDDAWKDYVNRGRDYDIAGTP
jgi:hypothetical protein